MKLLKKIGKRFLNRKVLPFLGLGLASQAPINLVGGTLKYWFSTEGVDLSKIGLFGLVLIPYSLKFLWAPFIDQVNLPGSEKYGRKKIWGLFNQLLCMIFLFLLSMAQPSQEIGWVFILCLGVTFAAATQDIVIDGLRIDTLSKEELKEGTSLYQVGARLGQLTAVAGMIFLSSYVAWQTAYKLSVVLIGMGFISLLFVKEKVKCQQKISFKKLIVVPFLDMVRRCDFATLCLFIVLYRLCNCMLGPMAYPFYYQIGFTAQQVSLVSGTFGVFVTMAGVFLGGVAMLKFKYRPLMFWVGCLEILTSLSFTMLALIGPDIGVFFMVILFDNILAGIGGVVWVVYLSNFCSRQFSAAQYAFLSAIFMIPLSLIAGVSGWLAEMMDWPLFFAFTGWLMLPALYMIYINKIGLKSNQKE